jgi:hypothetical protein
VIPLFVKNFVKTNLNFYVPKTVSSKVAVGYKNVQKPIRSANLFCNQRVETKLVGKWNCSPGKGEGAEAVFLMYLQNSRADYSRLKSPTASYDEWSR